MKKIQAVILLLLFSVFLYSQGTREGVLVVTDKNEIFGVAMNSGAIVFEADSNLMYELTAAFSYTADMDDVFTSGDYDVIGATIWKSYGTYIYPPSAPTYVDIPYIIRHHDYQNSQIEFVEGDILIRATEEATIGTLSHSVLHFHKDADSVSLIVDEEQALNMSWRRDSTTFYQDIYYPNVTQGSSDDSIITIDIASGKLRYVDIDRIASGGSGTVTEVTSSTTNQLTVANGTTTPALSIVTASVSDGETGLPTGDHVYDWVTGRGYIDDVVDDTSPQLGGYLDFNDKGYTLELTSGETLAAGDLCCFKNSDGEMYKADADAASTSANLLALCLESLTDGNTGTFLIEGIYTSSSLTNGIQYVSTSPGEIVGTAPSGTGDIVRIVGYNISSTKFLFKPDETYLEVD